MKRLILFLGILSLAGCFGTTRDTTAQTNTSTEGTANGSVTTREHRYGTENGQPVDITVETTVSHNDTTEQKQVAQSEQHEKTQVELPPEVTNALKDIPSILAKLATGNYAGAAVTGIGDVMKWFTSTPQGGATGLGTAALATLGGFHLHRRGHKKGKAEAQAGAPKSS